MRHSRVVERAQYDAKHHVRHAEYHRRLHFVRILKVDFIGGHLPRGIQTEGIRSIVVDVIRRAVVTGGVQLKHRKSRHIIGHISGHTVKKHEKFSWNLNPKPRPLVEKNGAALRHTVSSRHVESL